MFAIQEYRRVELIRSIVFWAFSMASVRTHERSDGFNMCFCLVAVRTHLHAGIARSNEQALP